MGGNMSKVCRGCRLEAIKWMHKRLKPGPFSSPSAWEQGYFILDNYCMYIFTLDQFVVDKQWKLSLLHKHILVCIIELSTWWVKCRYIFIQQKRNQCYIVWNLYTNMEGSQPCCIFLCLKLKVECTGQAWWCHWCAVVQPSIFTERKVLLLLTLSRLKLPFFRDIGM